ncbi:MAG: murein transglycosylase, partial [Rhodobacteraceae bacterium]
MRHAALFTLLATLLAAPAAQAATCGNTGAGFEAWKADFARIAAAEGVGRKGLQALAG